MHTYEMACAFIVIFRFEPEIGFYSRSFASSLNISVFLFASEKLVSMTAVLSNCIKALMENTTLFALLLLQWDGTGK